MPFIIQYKREYTHHKEYRWIGTQNRTECQSGIGSRVVEMRGGMKQNHFIAFVSSAAHKRRTALRKQHQQDNIFRIVVLQCLCARAADEWVFTAHTHTQQTSQRIIHGTKELHASAMSFLIWRLTLWNAVSVFVRECVFFANHRNKTHSKKWW